MAMSLGVARSISFDIVDQICAPHNVALSRELSEFVFGLREQHLRWAKVRSL
jgi:hypothetical protein